MKPIELIDKSLNRVPNFPKEGILFYDITGILTNPKSFKVTIKQMVKMYKGKKIDAVAAVESRGFLFAAKVVDLFLRLHWQKNWEFLLYSSEKKENCLVKLIAVNTIWNTVLQKLKFTRQT